MEMNATDPLNSLDDAQAAAAFRRLVRHLRHRDDVQNIDMMGHTGFCRNCLADWINDAGAGLSKADARAVIPACRSTSGRPATRPRRPPNSSPA